MGSTAHRKVLLYECFNSIYGCVYWVQKEMNLLLWASRKAIKLESPDLANSTLSLMTMLRSEKPGDLGKAPREHGAWRWFTVYVTCHPHFSSRSSGSGHRYPVSCILSSWYFSPQVLHSSGLWSGYDFHQKTDLST